MDPNGNQQTPNQPNGVSGPPVDQQPQPQYQQPQQPANQNPAAPYSPQPVATPYPNGTPPKAAPNKTLIFILIGVAILILIAVLLYAFVFSPSAMAGRASSKFMKAASAGDSAKMVSLASEQTDSVKSFMEDASTKVKGTNKLKEKTSADNKYYYLYSLSGADRKNARTTVEKVDGKWLVSSFVFSNNDLKLTPTASSSDRSTPTNTRQATSNSSSSSQTCLANSDYRYFNVDGKDSGFDYGYDATFNPNNVSESYVAKESVFFLPDTTDYEYAGSLDKYTAFSDANKDKAWKFYLQGSTSGSDYASAAAKSLANQRVAKVKADFEAAGIPSSRIATLEPRNYDGVTRDEDANFDAGKRVDVFVDPTCSNTTNETSSRSGR